MLKILAKLDAVDLTFDAENPGNGAIPLLDAALAQHPETTAIFVSFRALEKISALVFSGRGSGFEYGYVGTYCAAKSERRVPVRRLSDLRGTEVHLVAPEEK